MNYRPLQPRMLSDQQKDPHCIICGSSHDEFHNPLICVTGSLESMEDGEFVHLACARRSSDYGFCRYCNHGGAVKVFYVEDINDEGECSDHEGESVPDYPEADQDSFIENMQDR